jgi:hypothetical protein
LTRASAPPDLVFLTDWLPPDFGAVGQYSLERAREFAREGRRVALYGLSSAAHSETLEEFGRGSLRVVRLKAPLYDRSSLRQRAWWTLRANAALLARALGDLRGCGELMFTGAPPFLLHFVAPLNVVLRRRLVYRITDFFPEALIAERGRASWLLALLMRLTVFWRRRVHRIEALGEDQRRRLLECGVSPERIVIRRDPSPVEIRPGTHPLPAPAALAGRRILLYSGNYGVAHEHASFLEGYVRHHREGSGRVGLWLNATGSRAELLERALSQAGVPFHRSRPVSLEELPRLLVTPAAHLITLRAAFWGYVLPSKVYGCIDSGRSILYVGPRESDVHRLCAAPRAGVRYWQVEPGDAEGVYRALEEIGRG